MCICLQWPYLQKIHVAKRCFDTTVLSNENKRQLTACRCIDNIAKHQLKTWLVTVHTDNTHIYIKYVVI